MNLRFELHHAIFEIGVEYEGSIITERFADKMIAAILEICPTFVGVLDGTHVVVPKEPTPEMLRAGAEAFECIAQANHDSGYDEEITAEYRAMIEATQEEA